MSKFTQNSPIWGFLFAPVMVVFLVIAKLTTLAFDVEPGAEGLFFIVILSAAAATASLLAAYEHTPKC